MKKVLIISVIAVVIVGAILYFFLTGSGTSSPTSTQSSVTLPSAGSANPPGSFANNPDVLSIAGMNGTAITTNDFLKDPETIQDPSAKNTYYLGYHFYEGVTDTTATTSPPYVISYLSATQYFNVALLQEPIGDARAAAEQYLMTHLGVPEGQLCNLNYVVSVPATVNTQYAGKNLGFSFCSGATQLPL